MSAVTMSSERLLPPSNGMTAGIKPTGSLSLRGDMAADVNPTHSLLLSQNIAANYKSDTGAHT